jgi:dUTPase
MKPIYKFAVREGLGKEFLPTRAEPKASGWDVRADLQEPLVLKPFQHARIPLGFRAFCPEGFWLELKPRSSTFAKKFLHSLYGTIDETYEGMMIFACQYIPDLDLDLWQHRADTYNLDPTIYGTLKNVLTAKLCPTLTISHGDAIGQLIPIKRQEMEVEEASNEEYDELCKIRNAERGAGGFGSTENKK